MEMKETLKMRTALEYNHMNIARSYLGVAEIPGPKHSAVILRWLEGLGSWVKDDETAWCGTFVAHVILSSYPEALPKNWLSARAWLTFGVPVVPQYGAVLVFWRGKKDGPYGHVGFYVGEDDTHYHVLGGNQNNKVSVTRIPKARLLGARRPTLANFPKTPAIRRLNAKGAPVSTTEA